MRRPSIRLVGEDGNIFAVIGRVTRALKQAGTTREAIEHTFQSRVFGASSYDEALRIVMEYVEVE